MINFRYHLVSIVAVFLAIAIGVVIGSTVIDSATVSVLERQQESLDNRIDAVEAENDQLRGQLGRFEERDEQLDEQSAILVAGRLSGVPVLTISVRGFQGDVVDAVRRTLVDADAAYLGTVWLTDRFVLDDEQERTDLAEALSLAPTLEAERIRAMAIDRLAAGLATAATTPLDPTEPVDGEPAVPTEPVDGEQAVPTEPVDGEQAGTTVTAVEPPVLTALRDAGFVDFDVAEGANGDLGVVVPPGSRFVVLSGPEADVPSEDLAAELVRELAAPDVGVVAAEPVDHHPPEGEPVSNLVTPLLADESVAGVVSTVDNVGRLDGRLAVVYALADLGVPVWGHYGEGPGAQRRLPAPPA